MLFANVCKHETDKMKQALKEVLGISELEKRMTKLEKLFQQRFKTKPEIIEKAEKEILKILKTKMTTTEIAKKLNQSRSWTSLILNKLEKEKKVKEAEKKGKTIFYERIK